MNIVFDFGAVLFTWKPAELLAQTFPERVPTEQDARALAHAVFAHADWHAFDAGTLEMEEVIARIVRRLQLPMPGVRQLVESIGDRLAPIEDTLGLLGQLHARRQAGQGVQGLYYLSNMPRPYARELEALHPFLQWFDGGIFSGDVHHIKPDPAIYQMLQQRHGLEPGRTLFIDDLHANVRAAHALGWQAVQFHSAAQLAGELRALQLVD